MPWRVDRYLAREIVPPFLLAILVFWVFISLELVISLSDTVLARGAGVGELLRLLVYKLPMVFSYALPAAVLLATFLALGRLAADRELLAFQTVGYSLRRLTLPFLVFGALVSGGSYLLGEYVIPASEAAYRQELLSLLYRGAAPKVQEAVFFRGLQGETYYLERVEEDKVVGVLVFDQIGRIYTVEGRFPTVITAQEGRFHGGTLELFGGRVMRFSPEGGLAELVRFDRLTLEVGEELRRAVLGGKTPSEMSVRELGERIELLRRSGLDPRALVVEYHAKLALTAAAFVFVLFGAPLGALLGRRGRATGAIVGFLLVAAAQGLYVWARTMAQRGVLPPFLGGWLPHMGFAALGLLLFVTLDRLRLRGLLTLAALLAVGWWSTGTPLPLDELTADELEVEQEGRVWHAVGAWARVGAYTLKASSLRVWEEGQVWKVQAESAVLQGQEGELTAAQFLATLTPHGEVQALVGEEIAGQSTFQGPEKSETLIFRAQRGQLEFADGELVRVEGVNVEFTTCPCLTEAPYRVRAEEFVLLPKRWLYARAVAVHSFDIQVLWLPVYVARLGEESSPFFPQIGWAGNLLYLRWAFPLNLGEGTAGALGLTWYPTAWRVEPSLTTTWEGGSLSLSLAGLRWRAEGQTPWGPWQGTLTWTAQAIAAELQGQARGWSWSLAWGRVEREDVVYERIPELSAAYRAALGGGDLDVQLSGGLYREGEVDSQRLGVGLSWSRRWNLGPAAFNLTSDLRLDLYGSEEKAVWGLTPALTLGGFSVSYSGRWRYGRSPFSFDADHPLSQVTWSLSAAAGPWRSTLTGGWDFNAQAPLTVRWSLAFGGLSIQASFQMDPLTLARGKFTWTWKSRSAQLVVEGGMSNPPWRWDDVVVRGLWTGEGVQLTGGVRWDVGRAQLRRAALSGEWAFSSEWFVRLGVEYDGPSRQFVQVEGSVARLLAGCLRMGVALGTGGFSFQVEVPAFPQAQLRFAPFDEGLRWGQ